MKICFISACILLFFIKGTFTRSETENVENIPVQYRLRQIMIEPAVSQRREAEILKQAKECLQKAVSGADFTWLAKNYSREPGARKTGGDLGFFEKKDMVKPFSDAVFAMKEGEILGPVKTQFGFHIIKLIEVKNDKRHAQHILFTLNPDRSDSLVALDTLSRIRKKVLDGADFSDMINLYTTNDLVRETDGYMVWQRPEEMLPPFAKAVKGLKTGDMSLPFTSILGFHIVMVDSINYNPDHLLVGFPVFIEKKLKKP